MRISGNWAVTRGFPPYLTHLKETLSLVKPGFTVLADMREMEEFTPEIQEMHLEAQRITVAAGISQLVEVHDPNNSSNQQAVDLAVESSIPLNIFNSLEDAQAWLSEVE